MTSIARSIREDAPDAPAAAVPAFDAAKAQAFAGRMLGAINDAAFVLMTSVGHRTGLFGALASISPCTATALAAHTGLAERYVREWLAVMVTARAVTYAPDDATYHLPAEHSAFLTAGGPVNIAISTQFLGVVAGVEDEIVARFADGKGKHYHHYGRFHAVMAEVSDEAVVSKLIDHILPLAPEMTGRLEAGIDVIDAGCGAGKALLALARRFPRSRFTGFDLCPDAFAGTQETARDEGLANLAFRAADLSGLDHFGACDLAFAFDAVHDQRDPARMLRAVRASLRPGGAFLMVDIGGSSHLERNLDHPVGSHLYMMSCMHCTPVSLGQGGPGLGAMWGVEMAERMLGEAGFGKVAITRLPHDIVNAYFVARP